MKKLKRALLINWLYFSKQIVDFGDINFLTGKNSAGKSTLIDAMQVVLLGEKSGIFNKAANDKSQRKIEGYLWADNGSGFSPRRGKSFESYIALEFYDDIRNRYFTLGIIFECSAGGSFIDRYFAYNDKIPKNCFYENNDTMDLNQLRVYFKENNKDAVFYDTNKTYKNAVLARFNLHTERYFSMMKKGIAFDPITDIQKFITESICDFDDEIDPTEMQETVREYQQQVKIAETLEKKLGYLKEINSAYKSMLQSLSTLKIQRYLITRADYEAKTEEAKKYYKNIHESNLNIGKYNDLIRQADVSISTIEAAIERLNQDEEFGKTQSVIEKIAQEISLHKTEVERIEKKLKILLRTLSHLSNEYLISLEKIETTIKNQYVALDITTDFLHDLNLTKERFGFLKDLTEEEFFDCDETFWTHLAEELNTFKQKLHKNSFTVQQILEELNTKEKSTEDEIRSLQSGKKPYHTGLLNFKKDLEEAYLRETGNELRSAFFADLLEMKDESWHNAVEGYLGNRRFYLIIAPEKYSTAFKIFKRLKEHGNYPFYLIGLADVGKIKEKEKCEILANSLATKVDTSDENAAIYLAYVLGRVICCEKLEDIRRHSASIMKDGMLYQSYVQSQIPEDRWSNPYIGRKSIEMLLQIKRDYYKLVSEKLESLKQPAQALREYSEKEDFLTSLSIQSNVLPCLHDNEEKKNNLIKIEELRRQRDGIDLTYFSSIKKQMNELKIQKKDLEEKKYSYLQKIGGLKSSIEIDTARASELDNLIEECLRKYEIIKLEMGNLEEVEIRYNQEYERLASHMQIYKNFNSSIANTESAYHTKRNNLIKFRENYGREFPGCGLNAENSSNEEYEALYDELVEIQLPQRKEQIKKAREDAMIQFQNDFINRLYSNIDTVKYQVKELNRALKRGRFGKDSYEFIVAPNPDYSDYYHMIMDLGSQVSNSLMSYVEQEKYHDIIGELFNLIAVSDDAQLNVKKQTELELNIKKFTDYRTYLKFDLEVTDDCGNSQLLSKTLKTKSGGESQTPFYIAMVAAFSQLYCVNESGERANTLRLVVFDEAFSKMDSGRFTECIKLFRDCGLQALVCAPDDKIANISLEVDITLYVHNENYHMQILPWNKKFAEETNE